MNSPKFYNGKTSHDAGHCGSNAQPEAAPIAKRSHFKRNGVSAEVNRDPFGYNAQKD